jgi:hypothetical protein
MKFEVDVSIKCDRRTLGSISGLGRILYPPYREPPHSGGGAYAPTSAGAGQCAQSSASRMPPSTRAPMMKLGCQNSAITSSEMTAALIASARH